jgi:hypothetical protein
MGMKFSMNAAGKKITGTVCTLVVLTLLVSAPAFSQELSMQENSPELQVKYLAGDNDALLFNLKYDNDSGNNFKLMVISENGEVLFQNNYSGKKFKRKIRLARLTDTDRVTFLVRSIKENVQLSYKVAVKKKVMDGLAITDMD